MGDEPTELTVREGAARKVVHKRLERGTLVGRYVVFDVIGEGGMGIVYNAYDPDLDRRLAIKLLQHVSGGDQAWLLREAQAMARLSHPNVIAVHDVGTLPGDRMFVAMELVEGQTLRAWLKAEPAPSWREVVRVMLAAGAGLAAAHAAGLVHRDFKPENVLVGGDGRVRVMDFGLARLAGEEPAERTSDLEIETKSPLSASLTVAGAVVGTPAYMAPEIYDGHAADARTDQFAFGVALYEALYRARPFDKRLAPPRAPGLAARPPPAGSPVPPAIQRVVARALALDRDARFATMDALLAELARDPARTRRRVALVAGAVAVIAAVAVGSAALVGAKHELCRGSERRLAGVWDEPTRQAVQKAFAATGRAHAAGAFAAVSAGLDRYAQTWVDATTESCAATRIRGEQTEDALSLRQDCLDQRLGELRAFTQLLARADATVVDKAAGAVVGLEQVESCADVAALRAPPPPPAEAAGKLADVKSKLADAKAGLISGKFGSALLASKDALEIAHGLKYDPAIAEAALVLGIATLSSGGMAAAVDQLSEATWAAVRSKRDDIVAFAAMYAAQASAVEHKEDVAALWLGIGVAAAARTNNRDPKLELHRHEVEGIIAGTRGDFITAIAAHEKALGLARELFGPDNLLVAQDEQLLGATYVGASEYAKAQPHYERAIALVESTLGPEHPEMALLISSIASCYHYTGDNAKAHAAFARALAMREKTFGADSPVLIPTLNNTAELLRDERDVAAGLPMIERAKTIAAKTVGPAHPYYHTVVTTRAELLLLANRVADARTDLDATLPSMERTASPALPMGLCVRARVANAERQWTEAAGFAERSIAGVEKAVGKDGADLWRPLYELAIAKVGLGQPAAALPPLERALSIADRARVPAKEVAHVRALLDDVKRPR